LGDNFTTPQHLNPFCHNVPPLLQGDLDIEASIVEFIVMGHVDIPHLGPWVADFIVVGLEGPCELVDAGAGGYELLGGNGGALSHCAGKSIGHHSCDFAEFISAETDEGMG